MAIAQKLPLLISYILDGDRTIISFRAISLFQPDKKLPSGTTYVKLSVGTLVMRL
jgi:hypothetical protein